MGKQQFFKTFPPTKGGVIFNLAMLLMPLVGAGIGWFAGGELGRGIGVSIGMIVAVTGWIWFFFIKKHRGTSCENCGRSFNVRRPAPAYRRNMGVIIATSALMNGSEGIGRECTKCGRIYCSSCYPEDNSCSCGSQSLRNIHLIYRK